MSMRKIIVILLFSVTTAVANAANHDFTGLPLDVNGWTDIPTMISGTGYDSSRIVYVDPTNGNDGNATIYDNNDFANMVEPSSVNAYQTLAGAYAQIRDGYADVMLLKRGEDFGSTNLTLSKSGVSATAPMIYSAYGSDSGARPIMGQLNIDGSGSTDYLLIAHIQLDDEERSMNGRDPMTRVLIEGCYFPPGPGHGASIQDETDSCVNTIDYLALRRNVFAGRYRPSGSGTYVHGIYMENIKNLLVEENIFDDNGADEFDAENETPDERSHNTYLMLNYSSRTWDSIWRYNISSRASSHCLQIGQGGTAYGNLCVECPVGIQTAREDAWWDGVEGTYKHNVILHGQDIMSTSASGMGMIVANIDGGLIEDNIIGDNTDSNQPNGFWVETQFRSGGACSGDLQTAVNDVEFKNNIVHNWDGDGSIIDGQGMSLSGADGYVTNITLTDNSIHLTNSDMRIIDALDDQPIISSSGNHFYGTRTASTQFQLSDTDYNLAGYMSVVSDSTSDGNQTTPSGDYGITDYLTAMSETATMESFYTNIRTQRKGNWDSTYTSPNIINWVRSKFGRGDITYSISDDEGGSTMGQGVNISGGGVSFQ